MQFSFRLMTESELPQLHAWMQLPHARSAFGHWTLDEVLETYGASIAGTEAFRTYTLLADNRPVGMMSWNRFSDYPEMSACYKVEDVNAINCDVLLAAFAQQGLGAGLIRKFLREIAFADETITSCIIDPHAHNAIAIAAYAKAGFAFVREVIDFQDKVPLHLMEMSRAALQVQTDADKRLLQPISLR
jgi:RimJ/RimL family protein N-acetyltransferase